MPDDNTERDNDGANTFRGEYSYALDRAPRILPPVDGFVLFHVSMYGDPEADSHPLPLTVNAGGFQTPVEAKVVFHALVRRLYRWQGKGFIQPVNDGARWHLQFREVTIQPPDTALATWLPDREALTPADSGIVFAASLSGFHVFIPPGKEPLSVHSFSAVPPDVERLSGGTFGTPPYVMLTVTRLHDRLCDAVIQWASQAGRIATEDLLAYSRGLWGKLAEDGRVHLPADMSPAVEVPKADGESQHPTRRRTKSADPGAIAAKFDADWKAGKVGDHEAWATSAGISGRTLRRYLANERRKAKPPA